MSDLESAAAALNVPEDILQRSAAARAAAAGTDTAAVLSAWAGGAPAPAASTTPEPTDTDPDDTDPGDTGETDTDADPGDTGPTAPAQPAAQPVGTGTVSAPPIPERVSPREALAYPVVVSVPTSGVTERTAVSLPRWLAAVFVLLPAIGLLYLTGNSGAAECEAESYTLGIDRATGVAENCDGTEFEGRAGALSGEGAQFFASGQSLYSTQACNGCHGAQGGGGSGPALIGVNNTFSSCTDHIEWVQLGTSGFQAAGRSTYGDLAKPVGGGGQMPAFARLSAEDLAAVVAFERIQFGGLEADAVLADCGLVEAPSDDGASDDTADESETTGTTEMEAAG